MVVYKIVYTKKSVKDIEKLKFVRLDKKTKALIDLVRKNPFQNPPSYEKLQGDLRGNIKHRLLYEVLEEEKAVKILNMWTHYEF